MKQLALLLLNDVREVGFGGAAGGGKSEGMLQSASQYLDVSGYKALILRRTFQDLNLPGALMERSHEWWKGTKASWDGNNHRWNFPEGSNLQFGYMEGEKDHFRYQGSEFQFIGVDEATQFPLHQYVYMHSRLRRLVGVDIPIRMRSATNPGGVGHEWYRERFDLPHGPPPSSGRAFIFSLLEDNPFLDQEDYERSLDELDGTVKKQLRSGDWDAVASGGKFDATKIHWHEPAGIPNPHDFVAVVRYWDTAGTRKSDANPDPDWTVGVKLGKTRFGSTAIDKPDWWILDVARCREDPEGTERFIAQTAHRDGRMIPQWFEQERGGAGKLYVASMKKNVLPYHEVRPLYVTGDKSVRAAPVAARMNEGRFHAVYATWNAAFVPEITIFDKGAHDDQVDALAGAFNACDRELIMQGSSRVKEY